jgi:hypothetical protein
MNCIASIAAASGLMWLAGCASVPSVTVSEPVGPAPASRAMASDQGYLEVYSARLKEDIRPDLTQWEWDYWDYPFEKNAFTYGLAHTDYIIRTEDGHTLKYVRNATNPADPQPTLVPLPPGRYTVESKGEEADGRIATVFLPVLIEPGRTTVAHLSGNWKPKAHFTDADVVRLPDGQIAGWLARQ